MIKDLTLESQRRIWPSSRKSTTITMAMDNVNLGEADTKVELVIQEEGAFHKVKCLLPKILEANLQFGVSASRLSTCPCCIMFFDRLDRFFIFMSAGHRNRF